MVYDAHLSWALSEDTFNYSDVHKLPGKLHVLPFKRLYHNTYDLFTVNLHQSPQCRDVVKYDQSVQKFDLEELMIQFNFVVKTSHLPGKWEQLKHVYFLLA